MSYVVTTACIDCKYENCFEVCPVDCFYEAANMIVINTEECIDCGVCEPECPVDVIKPDMIDVAGMWIALNQKFAEQWLDICQKGDPPADVDELGQKTDKLALLAEAPA
ncbi:ferredoxin family protein [Litoreibacter roseus]|uniref:ferredoxin family protein n=1 Tax=Litoreibacter roseus TaxID=2601869 RepID=UPI001575629C|nr:ferredoxin family protein [Litoreibacter roseus]